MSDLKPRFSLKTEKDANRSKKWLHIILRKWGFGFKNPKGIFEMNFQREWDFDSENSK